MNSVMTTQLTVDDPYLRLELEWCSLLKALGSHDTSHDGFYMNGNRGQAHKHT